jgi:lipoprotein-anchoring transpeptidase ErfK/SrfK
LESHHGPNKSELQGRDHEEAVRSGTLHPQSMARRYFLRKYYNAPMPHAIFHYGFAIHGTNDISRLGDPASHGGVGLLLSHAAAPFALVQQRNGPRHMRIEISNQPA